jgi:multidrug efflux pump subunit AcrA (membrane-fusion protein)
MSNLNNETVRPDLVTNSGLNRFDSSPASRPWRQEPRPWTLAVAVTILAGSLVMAWAYGMGLPKFREARATLMPKTTHEERVTSPRSWSTAPGQPWDGLVRVNEQAQRALSLTLAAVEPQTEPIRLEILGNTGYMTDFQTMIRPMFKGRADKVHVSAGQNVEEGEPLVDLYSAELAEAKSHFEIKSVHWIYDKSLLERRQGLQKSQAISTLSFTNIYEGAIDIP